MEKEEDKQPQSEEHSEETEALQPARLDPVALRIKEWADEAAQAPGGKALKDIDTLENLLDLTGAHPSGIAQLYGGRATKLSSLLQDKTILGSARTITAKLEAEKQASLARYGLYPTYLIVGVASWTQLPPFKEEDRGITPDLSHFKLQNFNLPVLLRPLELEKSDDDYTLRMDGSVVLNPVLEEVFAQRGIDFNAAEVLASGVGDEGFNFQPALDTLRHLGQNYIPSFDLRENLMVANLGISGAVLAADWRKVSGIALENPLVRAFAGDSTAAEALGASLPSTPPEDRDPDVERGIGDLDVSQARVVELVASGRSLFVEVPPGAPGRATIEAVLADSAASGKQVCYIPGVRRLGNAVLDGLKTNGIGDFLLDLTGRDEWRSALSDQLSSGQEQAVKSIALEDIALAHERLRETRAKLLAYTSRLHKVREPWGVSAYAALQALADLTSAKPGPRTKVKLDLSTNRCSSLEGREQARELLKRAQDSGLLDANQELSPWRRVVLSTDADAADAVSRVQDLAQGKFVKLRKYIELTSEKTGLVQAHTLNAWKEQLGMLDSVARSLEVFQPEVFKQSAADMVIATASARWRQSRSLPMKGKDRRALVKQAKDLVRPGLVVRNLHEELLKVQSLRDLWRRHALPGACPGIPDELSEIEELSEDVFSQARALESVLTPADKDLNRDPGEIPLADLEILIQELDSAKEQARQLPSQVQLLKDLRDIGLEPLLDDLRERKVSPQLALAELDLAWWSAILTSIMNSDPALAGIDGAALHELAGSLRSYDLAQVESLPLPVNRALSQRREQFLKANEALLGEFHAALHNGGISAPGGFEHFAPLVGALRPIWALSPFVAGQLYGELPIELLVLDHLDYLSLPQVVPLIARAKQIVVWGDSRRGWTGFTKAAAAILPTVSLRSDLGELPEQVAAFLASHGYGETVCPVPSPRPASLVNLHIVPNAQAPLARDQSLVISRPEIRRLVELCLDHALNHPNQSLAVLCLNPQAVGKIRKALTNALVEVKEAQSFFQNSAGRSEAEPFVVVESGGAAGLRRDVIILSLGMSKTPQGRVGLNFGPVSGSSGVAHLVGCLEAVRQRLEIVSAFESSEVDSAKVDSPGGKMLLDLLAAAGNPTGMDRALTTPESFASEPDRLLVDLAERLWREGLTVVPRFGLPTGVQIPLAIGHADLASELLVAVLTDDDTYVNEPSLRRRERLWPARLEAAGWKVISCYTNEVFSNPQAQAQRVLRAVQKALDARKRALSIPIIATPQFATEMSEEASATTSTIEEGGEGLKPLNQTVSPEGEADESSSGTSDTESVSSEDQGEASEEKVQLHLVKKERGPRPPVAKGLPLAAYGDDQLDELLEWICSDGVPRSEDEQVEELRENMELSRRGAQVDAVLRHAVRRRNAAL